MKAVAKADLSLAFLAMLERLTPEERAALILRDVFGYAYEDISSIIGRREPACRQLVHRAKVAVRSDRTRAQITAEEKDRMVRRLLQAMECGDEATLLQLVAPDSRWVADGGGKAIGAATRILEGYDRVSRMAVGLSRKFSGTVTGELIALLGESAIAWKLGDTLFELTTIETDGRQISGFYNVLNPEKLARVRHALVHMR